MFSEHYIDYFELPEMDAVQYLEIDDFKDYEYKNNIAYEFAVRNDKVLQSLEKFEKQFQEYEKEHQDLSHLVDHINMDHFNFLQKAGFDLFADKILIEAKYYSTLNAKQQKLFDTFPVEKKYVLNGYEGYVLLDAINSDT